MCNTVYSRLFDRLADLIPKLQTASAVFYAPPRTKGDLSVYCHISEVDGNLRLIELADDCTEGEAVMPKPWLKLRVDMANRLAEVLELEDSTGYQVVYFGGKAVNPCRAQINLFAVNWLQVLVQFELAFRPVDMPVAA